MLEIKELATADLIPYGRNSRTHSSEQIDQIARSIEEFGFTNPILITPDGEVIAGHGRLLAAAKLGIERVPCIELAGLSDAQRRAYVIADNQIALNAGWNMEMLKLEVHELARVDFNLSLLAFNEPELRVIFDQPEEGGGGHTDPDDVPENVETRCKPGDLWVLGNHRLLCGDSTNVQHVERLMGGEKADLVHTDPPYNVDYSNQDRPKAGKRDLGRIENDKMEDQEFLQFLTDALALSFTSCKDDASIYIWYASKETLNFHAAAAAAGWSINQQIIWKKPMLLGRGRYQWAHEPCVFAVKGSPYFTDDRTKTTVWDFGGYDKSKNVHPTQKPVVLPEEAIGNSSRPGASVLDLFLGSGSTLIACERTGRRCFGMEIDPRYCDVILERWEKFTGRQAELLSTASDQAQPAAEASVQSAPA